MLSFERAGSSPAFGTIDLWGFTPLGALDFRVNSTRNKPIPRNFLPASSHLNPQSAPKTAQNENSLPPFLYSLNKNAAYASIGRLSTERSLRFCSDKTQACGHKVAPPRHLVRTSGSKHFKCEHPSPISCTVIDFHALPLLHSSSL